VPQVGTGILFDGQFNRPRHAPPRLGEHTGQVLGNILGFDGEAIEALAQARVI